MKAGTVLFVVTLLLAACHTGREQRLWDSRDKNGLPDSFFFRVLQRPSGIAGSALRLNRLYVCRDEADPYVGNSYKFYLFDSQQRVYTYGWWPGEAPNTDSMRRRMFHHGYYAVSGDTLFLETIDSWWLRGRTPFKYAHQKTRCLISGDTVLASRSWVRIDRRFQLYGEPDRYVLWPE